MQLNRLDTTQSQQLIQLPAIFDVKFSYWESFTCRIKKYKKVKKIKKNNDENVKNVLIITEAWFSTEVASE